jgi:hypothetical protein
MDSFAFVVGCVVLAIFALSLVVSVAAWVYVTLIEPYCHFGTRMTDLDVRKQEERGGGRAYLLYGIHLLPRTFFGIIFVRRLE